MSNIHRLRQINSSLDPVITFAGYYDDEDDNRRSPLPAIAGGAAVAGAGYGGYKLHKGTVAHQASMAPGTSYGSAMSDYVHGGISTAGAAARDRAKQVGQASQQLYNRTVDRVGSAAGTAYGNVMSKAKSGLSQAQESLGAAGARTMRAGRQVSAGVTTAASGLGKTGAVAGKMAARSVKRGVKAAAKALSAEERINYLEARY